MRFNKPVFLLPVEDEPYEVNRIKRIFAPFKDGIFIKKIFTDGSAAVELLINNEDKPVS